MSSLVDAGKIERIVGATRHQTDHIGRAVRSEETFYILHSHECRGSGIDLRDCPFSLALDDGGVIEDEWPDGPAILTIDADGWLAPAGDPA